jgi:hypothetical protein
LTEDELILLLSRKAGDKGSESEVIKKVREKYRDHSELITKAPREIQKHSDG